MTKQRDLKAQARARAAKTGEKFTTAKAVLLEGARQPCPTENGECVLPKGHRSDEHGDDHQKADGTWWNVGKELAEDRCEVCNQEYRYRVNADRTGFDTLPCDPPHDDALVEVRGFAQPVPKELAKAIEVLRRRARAGSEAKDALLEALLNDEDIAGLPKEVPKLVFHDPASNYSVFETAFDRELMKTARELKPLAADPKLAGPTPSELRTRQELDEDEKRRLAEAAAKEPDCTCGDELGANAGCRFHHPPVVPVEIGAAASPSTGDVSIQSREAADGTTDFWLTRGGRDVYRIGYKDRLGNTVLATDATCTCPAKDGALTSCAFHHPKGRETVDVARRLLDLAIAGTGARGVVTVDTGNLTPEETARTLAEMKTRFNASVGTGPFVKPPWGKLGLCVVCGKNVTCECKAAPEGTTYARCTNPKCAKVYSLRPTESRRCEHCGHTPVEILDPDAEVEPRGGFLTAKCICGPTYVNVFCPKHVAHVARKTAPVRGRTKDAVMIDDANLFASDLDALPPVPAKDLVPVLEALKYINSGDAHADEAREEAAEALDAFDKKHPKVLTALMDPRDDDDFDPQEPIECIVNGKLCTLPRDTSYREVVQAAGFDGERVLSVTYRKGKHVGGILHVGEPILVERKMIFNVADTSNA